MNALLYRIRTGGNVVLTTVILIVICCLVGALISLNIVYEGIFLFTPLVVLLIYGWQIEEHVREEKRTASQTIDELRASIEVLRKRNSVLGTAMRLGGSGGWEFEVKTGTLTWTEQAVSMLALNRSSTDLDDLHLIYSEDSCWRFKERLENCEKDCMPFVVHLETIPTVDGETSIVKIVGVAVAKDGDVESIRGVVMNATPILDNDWELYGSPKELERLKAETLKVLKTTAHDLGSFLSGIIGLASLIKPQSLSGPDDRQALSLIHESAERAQTLVSELMGTQSIDKMILRSSTVDIAQLLANLIKIGQLTSEKKGISIELEAPQPVNIHIDSQKISRVINNILYNAIKFSYPGRPIIVKLTSTPLRAVITIQDFGIGIPTEMREKIFEIFTSGRPGTKGEKSFGMGLYISRSIVESHHGTLSMVNPSEGGTIFKIELPLGLPAGLFKMGTRLN